MAGCAAQPVSQAVTAGQEESAKLTSQDTSDKETLAAIAALSQVTRNQVFTEEPGGPEYTIGPLDVLELTTWEGTKPEKFETVVRQDGRISYSFLDDIPVSGLTPTQVDQELTGRLTKFLKDVRIDVVVKEYVSKSALLFGEVNILQTGKSGPGKYILRGKTTILDLLVDAGGATKDSDLKNVELVRQGKRYTLNLYDAMFKGDLNQNIIIDHGDVITVPELDKFKERIYVFGEVLYKGIYPHEEAFDLLAALGRAGGTTPSAVKTDIKIIRGYGKGPPEILSANLDDILKKGAISQNLALVDGDVVYVPRTMIGDLNEFITNTTPLLEYLFYPSKYRSSYDWIKNMRL